MPEYTAEDLASKDMGELVGIRAAATTQEQQNIAANAEHRAYAREETRGSPTNILAMPVAIPAYAAGKATGLIKGTRSETSLEQVKQAYIGYGEGVAATAKDFFGQDFSKTKEVIVEDVKEKAYKALEFFGMDFRSNAPIKPPVEAIKPSPEPSKKLTIEDIMPRLIKAESKGVHMDAQGILTKSPVGAEGITQLMPKTAKNPGYGIEPVKDKSEAEYLRVGKAYLQKMYDKFGDWEKALAAYNAGVGNVMRAEGKAERFGGDWKEHLPKKHETVPYINKVLNQQEIK